MEMAPNGAHHGSAMPAIRKLDSETMLQAAFKLERRPQSSHPQISSTRETFERRP
jgi:hypothetical protein